MNVGFMNPLEANKRKKNNSKVAWNSSQSSVGNGARAEQQRSEDKWDVMSIASTTHIDRHADRTTDRQQNHNRVKLTSANSNSSSQQSLKSRTSTPPRNLQPLAHQPAGGKLGVPNEQRTLNSNKPLPATGRK